MRIAFVVFDYTKPGGIEQYVRMLSGIFSDRNHEVYVFSSKIPKNKIKNITFHKINIPNAPFFLQLYLFSHRVSRFINKIEFDIVHNQGADSLFQDVITAHSCHRAWVECSKKISFLESLKKRVNPLHLIILENEKNNFRLGNYKKIIAVSENVKQEIVYYYRLPPDDIKVISLGVDIEKFNTENKKIWRDSIRKKYGLLDDDFVILFVANEFTRKGLPTLLRSLSKIRCQNVKLLVIGKGWKLPFVFLAKQLSLDKNIIFLPQTEHINKYYASCDLFVLPTRYEPFGLVVMEAMASGLPVMVSKIAGVSALIDEEVCLINNPLDGNELIKKILFFIHNQERGDEIGKKLRSKVENYTWEKVAEQTLEVYVEILNIKKRKKCS